MLFATLVELRIDQKPRRYTRSLAADPARAHSANARYIALAIQKWSACSMARTNGTAIATASTIPGDVLTESMDILVPLVLPDPAVRRTHVGRNAEDDIRDDAN